MTADSILLFKRINYGALILLQDNKSLLYQSGSLKTSTIFIRDVLIHFFQHVLQLVSWIKSCMNELTSKNINHREDSEKVSYSSPSGSRSEKKFKTSSSSSNVDSQMTSTTRDSSSSCSCFARMYHSFLTSSSLVFLHLEKKRLTTDFLMMDDESQGRSNSTTLLRPE